MGGGKTYRGDIKREGARDIEKTETKTRQDEIRWYQTKQDKT